MATQLRKLVTDHRLQWRTHARCLRQVPWIRRQRRRCRVWGGTFRLWLSFECSGFGNWWHW